MESVQQSMTTTGTESASILPVITKSEDIKLSPEQQQQLLEQQQQRKVFAILDDPVQPARGHSTCVFVNNGDSLGVALMKLNEQQALAVWGVYVCFVGITTKNDRQVRGGHLLKSSHDLNINDVMLEEDYLVVCPINEAAVKSEMDQDAAEAVMKYKLLGETVAKQEDGVTPVVKAEEDKSGKWAPEEDEKLISGLLKYGTKWSQIRKEFDLSYRSAFSLSKRSRRKTLQFRLQRARTQQYENNMSQLKAGETVDAQGQPVVVDPNNPDPKGLNQALQLNQPKMLTDMCMDDASVYRKRNWSSDEDIQLINGIKQYGQKWTTIYRECNFQHRSLPALAKRARKKSFQSLLKRSIEIMDVPQLQQTVVASQLQQTVAAQNIIKFENATLLQSSAPIVTTVLDAANLSAPQAFTNSTTSTLVTNNTPMQSNDNTNLINSTVANALQQSNTTANVNVSLPQLNGNLNTIAPSLAVQHQTSDMANLISLSTASDATNANGNPPAAFVPMKVDVGVQSADAPMPDVTVEVADHTSSSHDATSEVISQQTEL